MEPLKPAMRIAMLDVAKAHEGRLARILGFPHQFVAAEEVRQTVDAVIALRFGREQAARFASLAPYARHALVNGMPGLVTMPDGRIVAVMGLTSRDGRITEIDILADPVRLERLGYA